MLCAALAFKGIGVFEVGLAVFLGRLEYLVDHLITLGSALAGRDRSELVRVLESRLRPIRR